MKRLLAPIAALALVACESASTAPIASSESAALNSGSKIVHQVSAGGADWIGAGIDANWSLSAFELADGTVRGEWSDQFGHGNGGVHMTVTCLHVEGNEAWVTGVSHGGEFDGRVWMARLKDNGTSSKDAPDQISYSMLLLPGDEGNCHAKPLFELFDRDKGQVTIR